MYQPKNSDQLALEQIIRDAAEVAKNIGLLAFGLGKSVAFVAVDPKGAASQIQLAAGRFIGIAEELTDVAEELKAWEAQRIITKVDKPLVDINHNPL